ncbi:MAG TPA: DegV family protein [Lachnospiraceae bacterium]|nr:DegV family protein [Lachnospiraceae bacterium]
MKTAIMTDGNSGITVAEAEQSGIFRMRMPVIIDGENYFEGINLTQDIFYGSLSAGKDVTTSQPSPGDVIEMWEDIFSKGYDEIVYIPMSSGLSNSCESAQGLAKEYDGHVQVADNHRISVTQRQSVFDAKQMADAGSPAVDIRKYLEQTAYDSSIYIAVNTLEFLKKSGRVTAAGAALGTMLNIKPLLTIQGGKLDAFAKVRGMKKCETKIIEAVHHDITVRFAGVKKSGLIIGTAGTFLKDEDAQGWCDSVRDAFDGIEVYYNQLSLSIGSHVGPDAIGIGVSVKVSA